MTSAIGRYLWWLTVSARRRKPQEDSILAGFHDAVGGVLDQVKSDILTARLQRFVGVRDEALEYYDSAERTEDLDRHTLDRGIRRMAGETNDELCDRLLTLAHRNQFLGTTIGVRYLIEELFKLRCDRVVEYYADRQALLVLDRIDQAAQSEFNLSHIFDEADEAEYDLYRQMRVYSEDDLTHLFHFWVLITNPGDVGFDEEVVLEAINAVKPAHTRAVVYFWGVGFSRGFDSGFRTRPSGYSRGFDRGFRIEPTGFNRGYKNGFQ